MNGELAQHFALATHGSRWLRSGAAGPPPDLDQLRPFEVVRTLGFAGKSATDWLAGLAEHRIDRVWLAIPNPSEVAAPADARPAYARAAFSGGITAGLLTTGAKSGHQLWQASRQVGAPDAPDRRIWDISYDPSSVRFGPEPFEASVEKATEALTEALTRTIAFTEQHCPDPWTGMFSMALSLLRMGDAPGVDDQGLFPETGFGAGPRTLVAVVNTSWVFGGMGSWNDQSFDDAGAKAEYEECSNILFSALLLASMAAANSPED
jgi:hypothetical protein